MISCLVNNVVIFGSLFIRNDCGLLMLVGLVVDL